MFENINNFFKKLFKIESPKEDNSGKEAKERLHLVLMQDRANVSADFLEMMKQEIIEVIKKYIDVDENQIDVRLTNQENDDGSKGAPALYANIPIVNIKEENQKTPNNVGVDSHIEPDQTQQSNENTSNNAGVDETSDPNKLEQSNENASNNVGLDANSDPDQAQQSNENTSNDNNSDNIDTSNTQENIQQSNENMSNDQNDNTTSNQNMQN